MVFVFHGGHYVFLATDETERKSVIGIDNLVCEILLYTHVYYSN